MPQEKRRKPSRIYPIELKREAVQMHQDGHSPQEIAERLGLPRVNLIYKWRDQLSDQSDSGDGQRPASVEELQAELARVQRERDILKKALAILGRNES